MAFMNYGLGAIEQAFFGGVYFYGFMITAITIAQGEKHDISAAFIRVFV